MTSIDQQLTDAAIRYLALFQEGAPPNIAVFVQDYPLTFRDELAAYLEFVLAVGEPMEEVSLTPEEQAAVERSWQRTHDRIAERLRPAVPSLTETRKKRSLSTGRLAKQINLPVEVLARIERGAVVLGTLPQLLFARLAAELEMTEAAVRAMLAAPAAGAAGTRLSAQDGTARAEETPIPFAEALDRSTATPVQRSEWLADAADTSS